VLTPLWSGPQGSASWSSTSAPHGREECAALIVNGTASPRHRVPPLVASPPQAFSLGDAVRTLDLKTSLLGPQFTSPVWLIKLAKTWGNRSPAACAYF